MAKLKIAVMLNSLRMETPEQGFEKIAEMGVPGVHLSVGSGPFHPDNLDKQARKALLKQLDSFGLEVSALSAWGGGVHLEEDDCTEALEEARKVLELAADLECGIWQGHVGIMPEDESDPGWQNHVRHHEIIAKYGEQVGACLAIETGPEPPYVLKRLIETVGSDAIRLNWDPANLILWPARYAQEAGEKYDKQKWMDLYQPVEGLEMCGQWVVHVHAKDALVHEDGQRQEVPFGTGWVDWERLIELLYSKGFDGYFAIEREVGENPVADIQTAVDFLKEFEI
ncbi:MAG: sugar phosphate isomerase/epimerase [Armatimonadetes bacterium]|nr:sugar phosphate isomerase/epimerase [Armatimonadota bacterium]